MSKFHCSHGNWYGLYFWGDEEESSKKGLGEKIIKSSQGPSRLAQ